MPTRGSPRARPERRTRGANAALAQLVAIYRSPSYSPQQHRVNDTAILDATVGLLEAGGWRAVKTTELEVEQGRLPTAELYLNMCQGSLAAEQLMPLESDGIVVVNRPSSALNCHRYRLVRRLRDSTLPFPRTLILASSLRCPRPPSSPHSVAITTSSGSSAATCTPSVRRMWSPRRRTACRRRCAPSRVVVFPGWRCRSTCRGRW